MGSGTSPPPVRPPNLEMSQCDPRTAGIGCPHYPTIGISSVLISRNTLDRAWTIPTDPIIVALCGPQSQPLCSNPSSSLRIAWADEALVGVPHGTLFDAVRSCSLQIWQRGLSWFGRTPGRNVREVAGPSTCGSPRRTGLETGSAGTSSEGKGISPTSRPRPPPLCGVTVCTLCSSN